MNELKYAAVQNGIILSIFDDVDSARARIREEMNKDMLSIFMRRKLRKLFKKSGNIALHAYTVLTIVKCEEVSL